MLLVVVFLLLLVSLVHQAQTPKLRAPKWCVRPKRQN